MEPAVALPPFAFAAPSIMKFASLVMLVLLPVTTAIGQSLTTPPEVVPLPVPEPLPVPVPQAGPTPQAGPAPQAFPVPPVIPGPSLPIAQLSTSSGAIAGEPFGVGRIELVLPPATYSHQLVPVYLHADPGRIYYPAVRDIQAEPRREWEREPIPPGQPVVGGGRLFRRVGELIRQATAEPGELPVIRREVLFLIRGNEPLTVRLNQPDAAGRAEFVLQPAAPGPDEHRSALLTWWDAYCVSMKSQMDAGDYPSVVESYILSMLSGRLDLPLPDNMLQIDPFQDPSITSTLKLVAGTESVREAVLQQTAIGLSDLHQPASLPLPAEPRWQLTPVVTPTVAPEIEPLATVVPPECFYLRYGSFDNYLWFRDLSEQYGGDVTRMVVLRGSDNGAARRVEAQLNLKTTAMSRLLGGSVIEDQAIIGTDLFLSEGASLGTLLRTKNSYLLKNSLESERAALLKSDPEVRLVNETLMGRKVSFLHTLDNRVRSFMVVEGDNVLVTNSRTLMKRFLETIDSKQSLAATPEFQLARQSVPLSRGDSVFAYFSPAVLRGLVSPSSLIEMRRRLQSTADIAMVNLARLAAQHEQNPLVDPEDLVAAGYLPSDFASRADGSGLLVVDDSAELIDSLRGRVGNFLPIADVKVKSVNEAEAVWYSRIAAYHEQQWPQIDPIFIGIRRQSDEAQPGWERLEVHAEVSPWVSEKYGKIARQLGPPTSVEIEFAPDDIVSVQAHVVSDQLGGSIPPHHLFAAIKDTVPPPPDQFQGLFKTYVALQSLPGYLGAWPQPGLLDRLPLGLGRGQPVGPGMTRLIGGVYRYQGGGFSVLSMQSDVLLASLPHLVAHESDSQAQVRAHVGNLQGSQLAGWINQQLYAQAANKSAAGAALLSLLTSQLGVPPENAKAVATKVLGGDLQDPLGGNYVLVKPVATMPAVETTLQEQPVPWPIWMSDAWIDRQFELSPLDPAEPPATVPVGYTTPLLKWFRGTDLELTQAGDRLWMQGQVRVERRPAEPAP